MVRGALISLFVGPGLIVLLWGNTLALYFGIADPGAQAPYFNPPPASPGRHAPRVVSTRQIVPGAMPGDVLTQNANNNLDVVRHSDGRVYLAFRTAPTHFASTETAIVVVSTEDEVDFRKEQTFQVGSDLREPRLLSLGDRLFLYMSKLGKDPLDFEPKGVLVSEQKGQGEWTEPEDAGLGARILWRARVVEGRAVVIAYRGGENIYRFNGEPLAVEIFTTRDGRKFSPLEGHGATVYEGGGSEADFAVAGDGRFHGVIRNEAGDATGWGSLVCFGAAGRLEKWSCAPDRRKFDSPFAFAHDGDAYLVARRNVTEDGAYDVGWGPRTLATIQNQLSYITAGKRCSLWRFEGGDVKFVLDLPSRGDTCFPAVLPGGDGEVVVYDYSSPIEGPDVPWSVGQRGPTHIYRHVLRFDGAGGG